MKLKNLNNAAAILAMLLLGGGLFSVSAADSLFDAGPSKNAAPTSLSEDISAMADAASAVSQAPPITVDSPQTALQSNNAPQVASPEGETTTLQSIPIENGTNSPSSEPVAAGSGEAVTNTPALAESPEKITNQPVPPATNSVSGISGASKKEDATAIAPGVQPGKKLPPIPVDAPPNLEQPPEVMASSAAPPVTPTENVTLNLINRLVQRGILSKEDAGDLIRQAKEDAQRVSQQSQMAQQAATQAATAQQMAVEAAAPPSSDEAVSVSYVPEIVKSEMRDEIKRDVMAAAQSEGWTQPNVPEWLRKFRPFMDLRLRYQANDFPSGNSTDIFETMNYNAINTGWPINLMAIPGATQFYNYFGYYQAQNPIGPPTYNTTQQRDLARVRFRFGADVNLGDNFTSGFRIGTGQNGSPVSENQTFGFVGNQGMAQGGNFSSYAIWLDRAFLKYEIGSDPDRLAAITLGRFDNPFYTPTTMMWANDIGFDGIAAQARYKIFKGFTPFVSGGIFPIYNTDLNFPATQQPKIQSNDKYLYAAQAGIDWKITKDLFFKGAAGYYYFQNVQGKVSAPGITPNQEAQMSTDDTRPTFAQKGNTYVALRNIKKVDAFDENGVPTGNPQANYINDPTQGVDPYYINQFQYFGLATPYNILSANARLEYRHWEPFVVSLSGEWDRNLAWNSQNILNNGPLPGPENNYNQTLINGPVNNLNSSGSYNGGNTAWIIQAKLGHGALQKRWDWDFGVAYRYVESDAVIDGFCDSDFGGGGTNLKGFSVGGNLSLSKSVFIGARWLSATGIAGPTYKSDIIQVDVNARF
jgi:polyhydroxyalkanoate synthesis regulator phasin